MLVLDVLETDYGDVNLDGVVTGDDFEVLAANFSAPNVSWSKGDFDGDGDVDFRDFNMLANAFGR